MKIPRVIHQVHTNGITALGEEEARAIHLLKSNNPDWDYRFYDYQEMLLFVKSNYTDRYVRAFLMINPIYGAALADYFRYLLIKKVGGVYLDTKSFTAVPIESILHENDEFVVFSWQGNPRGLYANYGVHKDINRGFEYQQWNIISTAENKYISSVVEAITKQIECYSFIRSGVGWEGVLKTTGPIPYTNAIEIVNDGMGIRFAGNNEVNGIFYRNDAEFPTRIYKNHYSSKFTTVILRNPFYDALACCYGLSCKIINRMRTIILTNSKVG